MKNIIKFPRREITEELMTACSASRYKRINEDKYLDEMKELLKQENKKFYKK